MGDTVTAVRLAAHVLEYGFDEEDTTDVRLRNFQNDVFTIQYLLEKLNEALQNAQRRYLKCPHPIGIRVYEPLSQELENERKTLTGNVVATLGAADELLTENRRIKRRYSLDPATLRWNLSAQEGLIDDLRSRLRLHARKINLILDCLSCELLTQPNTKSDQTDSTTSPHSQNAAETFYGLHRLRSARSGDAVGGRNVEAHAVSDRISDRLQRAMCGDGSITAATSIPIDRGFDTLLMLLEQSTSGQDKTPEKYLAFLKTRWLLDRIKRSKEYQSANPGLYLQHAATQITQALDAQTNQPGRLIPYGVNVLMSLPESCFQIWQSSSMPSEPPHAADSQSEPQPLTARATEEKVLSVPLASGGLSKADSLTVFKSSDDRFRLILDTSRASTPGSRTLIPQTLYTREDKLIPRYVLPGLVNSAFEVATFSRNEETLYTFNSLRDVYDFQSALTGYEVSHDQQGIRCQFSDQASSLDCCGRIQLWQEPIAVGDGNSNEGSRSAGSSTIGRRRPTSDRTASVFGSVAPSLATTHTVHQAEGGWEADSVKLATMVIFTELVDRKKKKRFAIISIPLGVAVSIDPKQCRCCRDYDTCSKLVLTKGRKSKFVVRTLYTDLDPVGQPNTNTFDLLPFRTPLHPAFDSLVSKQTEYLVLKFPNLEDKRRFDNELQLRFRVRDAQLQNQLDFAKSIRRAETQRRAWLEPTAPMRSPSFAQSVVSIPPKIDVLDSGTPFVDAMKELKIAELTDDTKIGALRPGVVEVSGDRPLVELATDPKARDVDVVRDQKSREAFLELPGVVPWFPAA